MKVRQGVADIIRRYYEAYEAKDRQALAELLSDPFSFSSPLDDHIDKARYFERCWPNSENIKEVVVYLGSLLDEDRHPLRSSTSRREEHPPGDL